MPAVATVTASDTRARLPVNRPNLVAVGTIVWLSSELMFFAGLFLPIGVMPSLLANISRAAPLGAAVQALTDATQGRWPHPLQLVTLLAYTVVFGGGALKMFRWQ